MHTTATKRAAIERHMPVADYRGTPDARERQSQRLMHMLQRREILLSIKIIALLFCGGLLCLLGPLILAATINSIARRLDWPLPFNSLALLAMCSVVMIPILFWFERRTGGRFLEQSIDEHRDWLGGPASSYGHFQVRGDIVWWILKLEFLLYGPRMVLSAVRQFRERKALPHVSLVRGAEILLDLLAYDEGLGLPYIKSKSESVAQLRGTLRYLVLFDFIGLSRDGARVWLLSRAREKLLPIMRETC